MSLGKLTEIRADLHARKLREAFDLGSILYCGTSTNSTNAFTLDPGFPITLTVGQRFAWIPNAANSGASTLTLSPNSAAAIVRDDGSTALAANDLKASRPVVVMWDGTSFRLLAPSQGGNGYFSDISTTNLTATNIVKAWTTWVPTVTYTGGGSMSSIAATYKYRVIGSKVEFLVSFDGTVTGTVTAINLSLPAGVTIIAQNHYAIIEMNWGGGRRLGTAIANNSGIILREVDTTAFPGGGGTGIEFSFFGAEI